MQEDNEILDFPSEKKRTGKDYRLLRYSSLLSFIIALFIRLFNWPGHVGFIILGAALFLIWSFIRFINLPKKEVHEWIFLPARVLLIGGLTLRYTSYAMSKKVWLQQLAVIDEYLVYIGLGLFVLGFVLSLFHSKRK